MPNLHLFALFSAIAFVVAVGTMAATRPAAMPARPKVRCGQDEEPALRIEIPVFSARDGEVAIVTKRTSMEGATSWAQGGIAAVVAEGDTFEAHVRDTLEAGQVAWGLSEIPSLIVDISQTGLAAGLQEKLFEPARL